MTLLLCRNQPASQLQQTPPAEAPKIWDVSKGIEVDAMATGILITEWCSQEPENVNELDVNNVTLYVEKVIAGACDFCLQRKKPIPQTKQPAPWWSNLIGDQRRKCIRAKRAMTKKASATRRHRQANIVRRNVFYYNEMAAELNELENIYKSCRKELKNMIQLNKQEFWFTLISFVERDPWGKPYKMVMDKLRGPPVVSRMEAPKSFRWLVRCF